MSKKNKISIAGIHEVKEQENGFLIKNKLYQFSEIYFDFQKGTVYQWLSFGEPLFI